MDELNKILDSNDLNKILEFAIRNKDETLDLIGQKKLLKYALDRGADADFLSSLISEYLVTDDYKKVEPFMEYANVDTLLIRSVELNWPDGINYAVRKGAQNFDYAIYQAIQSKNFALVEYLEKQKRKKERLSRE